MIKLTLELTVTMMKARRLIIVIETGMYDLKFKVIAENSFINITQFNKTSITCCSDNKWQGVAK